MNNEITENAIEQESNYAPAALLTSDESLFEFVIVAAQRCKQLSNGAPPRVAYDVSKRKNTSIAREEVRGGLVSFTTTELAKT